jgi:transcriptional regulator with GAF, ATPase, and Fis domain
MQDPEVRAGAEPANAGAPQAPGADQGPGGPGQLAERLLEQAGAVLNSDPAAARGLAEEAISHARPIRERRRLVRALNALATACRALGDRPRLERAAFESVGLALALHDLQGEQTALALLAEPNSGSQGVAGSGEASQGPPVRESSNPTDGDGVWQAYAAIGYPGSESDRLRAVPAAVERRPLLEKALEFVSSRASTDMLHDGDYLLSIGALCRELGEGERSVEYSCRALVEYERTRDEAGRAACYNNIGEVYLRRGRYERAIQVFETVLSSELQQPAFEPARPALGFLGDACRLAGDLARAGSSFDRLLALARDADDRVELAGAQLRKAELLLAGAELPEASELLRATIPLVLRAGIPFLEAQLQRVAALLLAARNESEPARTCFAAAIATLERLDRRPELARTLDDSGRFLIGLGERKPGAEHLQRAAELLRTMEDGDAVLEIHRFLVQQESAQDRRLLVLHSLSSLATQSLPAADFAARSLSLLRDALRCRHATIYLAASEQFLGDSPDGWEDDATGDAIRECCRAGDVAVSTRVVRLPLNLAGSPIGTACLCRTSDQPTMLDGGFLETLGSLLALGLANGLEVEESQPEGEHRGAGRRAGSRYPGIIGNCRRMQEVYELVERVAPTPASVLIRGESGTGKELVARAVHERSPRAGRPFVAINCAAIPEALLEAELLGIEKGTATGVAARVGKFELANGGTLFLDEIGDMSLALQAKLLRVLQSQSFERVGGRVTTQVDVRVIAATNRDLERAMRENKFRQDLYYRLNVMTILLPPLRERRDDLPTLVSHYVQKCNQEFGRQTAGVSPEVMEVFRHYPWPGNVRELVNLIERAVILCPGETIQVTDLPVPLQEFAREHVPAAPAVEPTPPAASTASELWSRRKRTRDEAAKELEQKLIADALERSQGNVAKAAREVGVSRVQFYRLLDRYGMRKRKTPDA